MTSHAAFIDRQALADALLSCGPWKCSNDDQALIDHATAQARAVELETARLNDPIYALQRARRRATQHHLTPPMGYSCTGELLRLACPLWWRRQLRRLTSRRREQRQRLLGRTQKRAGIYVSNEGYRRRIDQATRNARLLEAITATNQEGDQYTLAELTELGLANPEFRRAELMLRIADTEREADRAGHCGMFYTITTPSRFHPVRQNASLNHKYAGADPREAQAYLQNQWAKARAKLKREGLGIYGIRVAEPHHDGTPHWHLLIWMRPEDEARVTGILRRYALEDSPGEVTHNTSIRFKAVKIDRNKGSAAGYVAKYVAKNINGKQHSRKGVPGDNLDHYGQPLETSAPRIEAWAACWGIRQFQFVGLPSVTVWREVRRLKDEQRVTDWEAATRPEPEAAAILDAIRKAAIAGAWDKYLYLMGGPMQPRAAAPIRPWRVVRQTVDPANINPMSGEWSSDTLGRYGEPMASTWGLVVSSQLGETEYLTRYYRWTFERKGEAAGVDFQRVGEAAAPWTCVINCTQTTPKSTLDDWEWHITESFRRMFPPLPRERVSRIQQQATIDAHHYRVMSVKRRLEHEERERLRASLEEGRELLIAMLAHGELSPADIPPGVLA
ncbi:replication endonuclease [Halomonas sp. M1]|uniref:replication endonuclease n=1 Tax=Halomonas sp. M1 TaxID=3035470 RepID=UPI0024867DFF|nr:replication endonuclease [Halomonas sp. M1]WFE72565.1 replication endonuclease [Halomonas sp. M1]